MTNLCSCKWWSSLTADTMNLRTVRRQTASNCKLVSTSMRSRLWGEIAGYMPWMCDSCCARSILLHLKDPDQWLWYATTCENIASDDVTAWRHGAVVSMQTTTVRLCYIARIERGYYWDTLYTSVCIDPFRRAGSGDPSRTSIPKLLGEIRLIRCCTLYPVSVT